MADRHDLAVAAGADPDPLDGRGAMGGVIENQRPLQRQFYRPSGGARAERSQDGVGADKQLAAEAAADERRHQPDILLRVAQASWRRRRRPRRSSGSTYRA